MIAKINKTFTEKYGNIIMFSFGSLYEKGVNIISESKNDYSKKYEFLYNAINDTQETIRFTDTKSGVVIVIGTGLIAAFVTLCDKYVSLLNTLTHMAKIIAIIGVSSFAVFLFIALALSIRSINPCNNPNEHIDKGDWEDRIYLKYYISGLSKDMRFEDYLWELKDSKLGVIASDYFKELEVSTEEDLLKSLTLELLKLSYIKEKKL